LHPRKTRIADVRQGFEFLGYTIKRGRQLRPSTPGRLDAGVGVILLADALQGFLVRHPRGAEPGDIRSRAVRRSHARGVSPGGPLTRGRGTPPRGLTPPGAFRGRHGAGIHVHQQILGGKLVGPVKVSFQVRGKFVRAEAWPFLDDHAVGVEQRYIRGDDKAFGRLALLYHIKPVSTRVVSLLKSQVPEFHGASLQTGQPGTAQPGCAELHAGVRFDRGRAIGRSLGSFIQRRAIVRSFGILIQRRAVRRAAPILLTLDPPGLLILLPLQTAHFFLALLKGLHMSG